MALNYFICLCVLIKCTTRVHFSNADTLRYAETQENSNEETHVYLPGSDLTPTDSFASSTRTGSDIAPLLTNEMTDNTNGKQDSSETAPGQNKPDPSVTITSKQVKMAATTRYTMVVQFNEQSYHRFLLLPE